MSPFDPIGEKARWRIVYDVLAKKDHDDTVTYAELGEALDLDPTHSRHQIQMAVRRAAKEYLEIDKRALEPVKNQGYRVVQAPEHLRLAQMQQRKSRRALDSGHSKVVNVDLNGMDPEVRKAFDVTAQAFGMLADLHRRLDVRQKRLESAVEAITERSDRSDAEVAELRARLERLEKQNDQPD